MAEAGERRRPTPRGQLVARVLRGRALRVVLTVAVVAAVFFGVLPQLADLEVAGAALLGLPGTAVALLGVLAAGVLLATWLALARLIEDATLPQASLAHVLSTAVANTVPAGGAVAVGVNLQVHGTYGRTGAQTTTGLLSMGVLDNLVKLGLPIVLVAISPVLPAAERLPTSAAIGALAFVVVAAVVIAALARPPVVARAATRVQSVARRLGRGGEGDWATAAVGYVHGLRGTLRRHGPSAFVAVLASHVLQVAVLLVALRSLGVPDEHAGILRVTVVYVLVRLVTALPVTPGGLGVAELGLVAGLRAGVPAGFDEPIVAASLLFRAATYLLPVLLAAPAWGLWRWDLRRRAGAVVGEGPTVPGAGT
jgi:putative heme transporter